MRLPERTEILITFGRNSRSVMPQSVPSTNAAREESSSISASVACISSRKDRGIDISEQFGEHKTYNNLVEVIVETEKDSIRIAGTITEEGRQRIVRVNDNWIDFVPEGQILLFRNYDKPGVIGKVGTILGENGINIANFALGRKKNTDGFAFAAAQVDGELSSAFMTQLNSLDDMVWVTAVDLREQI